jgi:hypothetical protein
VKCVHRKDKGQDKAGDSNGMFPTKVDFPLSVGLGDDRFYGGPTFGYYYSNHRSGIHPEEIG